MKSPKFWLRVALLAALLGLPMFTGCGETGSSSAAPSTTSKTPSATP